MSSTNNVKKTLFYYTDQNLAVKDIQNHVAYFKNFKQVEAILDSQESYEKISELNFIITAKDHKLDDLHKALVAANGFEIFQKLLVYLADFCDKIEFEGIKPIPFNIVYETTSLNERRLYFLLKSIHSINFLLPNSLDFRDAMIRNNGLKALLQILKCHSFIEKLTKFDISFVGNIIYSLVWLTKVADKMKNIWKELNAIQIFLDYSKKFQKAKIFVYMATCNIASDKDLDSISELNAIIDMISDLAIKTINHPEKVYYKEQFIDEETKKIFEFDMKCYRDTTENVRMSLAGFMLTLYRLALNEKVKWILFQKTNLIASIKKLVLEGNDVEKQYGLRLLTQLCFSDKVIEEMRKDTPFNDYVQTLYKKPDITFKKLYKTCEQYLFLLKQKIEPVNKIEEIQVPKIENNVSKGKNLVISFSSSSKDLTFKLKASLEKLGFKVWIDEDEIHSSSLEAMVKAINESDYVLICVDEKYRQSVSCQTEAQYAYKNKKSIFALINQDGYGSVEGWVGFVISNRPSVDFTKNSFDDAFKKLLNLFDTSNNPENKQEKTGLSIIETKPEPVTPREQERVEPKKPVLVQDSKDTIKWDEAMVESMLKEKELSIIWEALKPINGAGLFQLYQMQTETPEFLFSSINSKNPYIDFQTVYLLTNYLKELFEK